MWKQAAKMKTLNDSPSTERRYKKTILHSLFINAKQAIKPKVQTKTQSNQKIPILGEFLKDLKLEKLNIYHCVKKGLTSNILNPKDKQVDESAERFFSSSVLKGFTDYSVKNNDDETFVSGPNQ
ncbi:hypothetical protein GLOIN_2v1845892 [Rhizophagus irregularis DAOM 181602=DAOM 197198]|nr:hypothetical protein GLOIN_2v1845892 [Rhizophagus irregularis DAOM 181602=DAOM 197198]